MTRQLFHTKAHFYLAILIAFCMPFARLTPLFIALMLLNWLVEGDFKNKFHLLFKNKFALLFMSFYLLHLIGLLYTQNIKSGLFDIQVKFSLLIFPLMIASKKYQVEEIQKIFKAFIVGAVFSSLYIFSVASYYFIGYGAHRFFYEEFSILMHPSYMSMYINFILVFLFLQLLRKIEIGSPFSDKWSIAILLFLSFINILLSSKMGLLTMMLSYIGFLIYFVLSKKKYLFGIAGILLLLVSVFISLKLFPEMAGRVNRSIEAIAHPSTNQTDSESTAVRLLVWKAANQVIAENFLLGVGTGDAKDALIQEYEKRGMTGALENKLNSHNEFYQVFVSLGLIGFVFFILSLFLPLVFTFKTNNGIYILFLIIVILNFLPESMLERQAGVMFYAFFNSLLCFNTRTTKNY